MKQPPHALVLEARFYPEIADHLLAGSVAVLDKRGASHERLTVPGVLELPVALSMAVNAVRRRDRGFDLFVMLGCVIRGETSHYDVVAGEANRAIMDLAVEHRLALGNGILTVENRAQALERARPDGRDKGGGAAAAALALCDLRAVVSR